MLRNRWSKLSLMCVMALCCAPLSGSSSQSIDFGINFDVISTDTSRTSDCKSDANSTIHGQSFIPRYGDPDVQRAIRQQLKGLRESGFRNIRSIVQLYPGAHPSGDLLDTLDISDSVLASIRSYVRDVRDAGFSGLILAFDAQGIANPRCRKSDWGDCFSPATIASTVEAERLIINAARSVKDLSLRVDLLNEACTSTVVPRIAKANFARFISAVSQMHVTQFREISATVSCQIERVGDGLADVQRLFAENGDRVGYFDIHAYPEAAKQEPRVLLDAAASLRDTTIPVIFGEMTYANLDYRRWIVDSYRAGFHHDPPEIFFWPLHSVSTHCNFDVRQPYRLNDALGTN